MKHYYFWYIMISALPFIYCLMNLIPFLMNIVFHGSFFFCLLLKCILVIRVSLVCRFAPFVIVKFGFEFICWFFYPSVYLCRRENSCVAGRSYFCICICMCICICDVFLCRRENSCVAGRSGSKLDNWQSGSGAICHGDHPATLSFIWLVFVLYFSNL